MKTIEYELKEEQIDKILTDLKNASDNTVSLAPKEEFKTQQTIATSAVAILDIATAAISAQPTFTDLKGVPELKKHQESSKEDAKKWRTTVRPTLFKVNDAIINFGTEFDSLYNPLYEFAGDLNNPDKCKEAQLNLIQGLKALQKVIKKQKEKVVDASKQIKDLQNSMLENEANLKKDYILIEAKYTGDKGKLEDLKKLVTNYESTMNKDLAIIGAGAGGVVVGVLTVAVGVAMWIESAGGSTPVILIGIGIIAAGTTAAVIGIVDYNKSSERKASALQEISLINSEIAVVTALKGSVTTLINQLNIAGSALDKLSGAWDQLDRDYENLIDSLINTQGHAEDTEPLAFVVQANLRTSKVQWQTLQKDAKTIKENLLAPMQVDNSAVNNSDGKTPSFPNVPKELPRTAGRGVNMQKMTLAAPALTLSKSPANSLITNTALANSGYRPWIENTAQTLLAFQSDLSGLTGGKASPKEILEAKENLIRVSNPAFEATETFLSVNELLSQKASVLREIARLDDDHILDATYAALPDLMQLVQKGTTTGQIAAERVYKLDEAIDTIDGALNKWLLSMKASHTADSQKLQDAIRLRDKAQSDKDSIKNDFWFCLLGVAVCAVVAIEVAIRVSNAQSEIDAFTNKIAADDAQLRQLMNSINKTTALTLNATALGKSIDGGLKAIQVILSTIESIQNTSSTTPFIVRAHINALASQLEGVSTVRLQKSSQLLFARINETVTEEHSISLCLQNLFSKSILIQNSAQLINKQPKLVYVENLLKQDQAILRSHTMEWTMSVSNNVLSQLSALRAIGNSIEILGDDVLSFIQKGDTKNAEAGIEALKDSFVPYIGNANKEGRLFRDKIALQLFLNNIKNDQAAFTFVESVIKNDLKGDDGELLQMELREESYTLAINQQMEEIVNNSTRMVTEYLAYGVVMALTVAAGQIQFAAVQGPTLMYLIKKGANIAIKQASKAGASKIQQEIKKIQSKGDKVEVTISDRAKNLESISKLKADIAVLKVLTNDTAILDENTVGIMTTINKIRELITDEIDSLNIAKYTLRASNFTEAENIIKALMQQWSDISKLSDALERSFIASVGDYEFSE